MKKFILAGLIITIIIGIISALLLGTFWAKNEKEGTKSTSGSPKESMPQGRNLTIEFNEKMGLSAP